MKNNLTWKQMPSTWLIWKCNWKFIAVVVFKMYSSLKLHFKTTCFILKRRFYFLLFFSKIFPSNKIFIWSFKKHVALSSFLFWITSPSWLLFSFLIWKESWKFWEVEPLKNKTYVAFSPSVKNETFFLGAFACGDSLMLNEGFLFFVGSLGGYLCTYLFIFTEQTLKICQQAFPRVRSLRKTTANLLSSLEILLQQWWFSAYFKKKCMPQGNVYKLQYLHDLIVSLNLTHPGTKFISMLAEGHLWSHEWILSPIRLLV